ncbi:MAG: hypothetical protein R2813_13665 [Flavobacteriales bacterium]
MNRYTIAFALSLLATFTVAQNAFDDSNVLDTMNLNLNELDTSNDVLMDTLKNYVKPGYTIAKAIQDNPFLGLAPVVELAGGTKRVAPSGIAAAAPWALGALAPSSLLNYNATALADGLSDLLIERAKEELNVAFFSRFERFLEEHEEAKHLFPETVEMIQSVFDYQYPNLLPALREAFADDLEHIHERVPGVFDLDPYHALVSDLPHLQLAIQAYPNFLKLHNGQLSPIDLLDNLAALPIMGDSRYQNSDFRNVVASIQCAQIMLSAVHSAATRKWVSKAEMLELTTNPKRLQAYLALIWFQLQWKDVKVFVNGDTVSLAGLIKKDQSAMIAGFMLRLNTAVSDIQTIEAELKTANLGDKIKNKLAFQYINRVADMILSASDLLPKLNKDLKADTKLIGLFIDLQRNYESGQYASSMVKTVAVLDNVLEAVDNSETIKSKLSDEQLKKLKSAKNFLRNLSTYGMFMVNIVEAETGEEVKNAISAAALPVGSSSIKKRSYFNISVQSNLGVNFVSHTRPSGNFGISARPFVVTAPIGLSANWGLNRHGRNYGAAGFNLVVLDVGAMVDYKLRQDSTIDATGTVTTSYNQDYEIELRNIVSPGLMLNYSFPGSIPLAINIGGQYGPGLTKLTSAGTTIQNPTWRFVVGLSVDMPLFTIYQSNRRLSKAKFEASKPSGKKGGK